MRRALPLALAALALAGCLVDPDIGDVGELPSEAALVKRYGNVAPGVALFEASGEAGRKTGVATFHTVRRGGGGSRMVDVTLRKPADDAVGNGFAVVHLTLFFPPSDSFATGPADGFVLYNRRDSDNGSGSGVRIVVRRNEPGRLDAVFAAIVVDGGSDGLIPIPGPSRRQRVEGGFSAVVVRR